MKRSGYILDAANPVDWTHPDMQPRRRPALWLLAHPAFMGGAKWHDLMSGPDLRTGNHGTLTNSPAWGWGPGGRWGGFGSISTDGTNSYVDCGTPAGLNGAVKASYACWVYKPSNAVTAGLGAAGGSSVGGNRFSSFWFTDGMFFTSAEAASAAYGFAKVAVGWRRVVSVYNGATATNNSMRLKLYVDGQPVALNFAGTIPSALGTVASWGIGKDSSDRFCAGSYDDVSLWLGRALTAADVALDYDQSRRGHPDTLRWISTRAWFVPQFLSGGMTATVSITLGNSFVMSGAGQLAGTVPVLLGTVPALTGSGVLAATVPAAGTVSSAMTGSGSLAAAAGNSLSVTAVLISDGALAATAANAGSITGVLSGAGTLTATVSGAFGSSCVITGSGTLAGVAGLLFGAVPALSGSGNLSGVASAVFDLTPALSGTSSLAGTVPITSVLAGPLTGAGSLAGVTPVAFTPSGPLTGAGSLAGVTTVTSTAGGPLGGTGALASAVGVTTTAGGPVTGTGQLAGQVTTLLEAGGSLTTSGVNAITAVVGVTFTETGSINGTGQLAGVASTVFGLTPVLGGTGQLAGVASTQFTITGGLSGLGSGAAQAVVSVVLTSSVTAGGSGHLAGAIAATTAAGGLLGATVPAAGVCTLLLTSGGPLAGSTLLTSAVAIVSTVTAPAAGTGSVQAVVPVTLTSGGPLAGSTLLTSAVAIVSTVTAPAAGTGSVQAVVPVTLTASGPLRGTGSVQASAGLSFGVTGSFFLVVEPFPYPRKENRVFLSEKFFEGYWYPHYARRNQLIVTVAPMPYIRWGDEPEDTVNILIKWGTVFWEGDYQMYEHRHPVRVDDPQELRYRYRDQDGNPIDLGSYATVFLLVKYQGSPYETVIAEFADRSEGRVMYRGYSFPHPGDWTAQFVVVDPSGNKRHGDPARLKLVKNVETLDPDELMNY